MGELSEFLKESKISFTSSAKDIREFLKQTGGDPSKPSDRNVFWKSPDIDKSNAAGLWKWCLDRIEDLKLKDPDVNSDNVLKRVLTDVAGMKQRAKSELKSKNAQMNTVVPGYVISALDSSQSVRFSQVDLYTRSPRNGKDADADLFSNFSRAGDYYLFQYEDPKTGQKIVKMLHTKSGELRMDCPEYCQEVKSVLISKFNRFQTYMNAKLAQIDFDSVKQEFERGNFYVVQEIFNRIPECFLRLYSINIKYQKNRQSNTWMMDGFVAMPIKGQGTWSCSTGDQFVEFVARKFQSLTSGHIKTTPVLKNWANAPDGESLNVWVIPSEQVWKSAECPPEWKRFLYSKGGKCSDRIMNRLLFYLGALQDAGNSGGQCLMISDGGGTGKSDFINALTRTFKASNIQFPLLSVQNQCLNDGGENLSRASAPCYHFIVVNEYDGKSATSQLAKNIISGTQELSVKRLYEPNATWNVKGTKFMFFANGRNQLKSNAVRRRVIPVMWSQNYDITDDPIDVDKLVEQGRDFLNWCYKYYMECPFRTSRGQYLIMCEQDQTAYLQGKLDKMKQQERVMRAFSQDPQIAQYFFVGDYANQDSEQNDMYQQIIEKAFIIDQKGAISAQDLRMTVYAHVVGNPDTAQFFGIDRSGKNIDYKSIQWNSFMDYFQQHYGISKKKSHGKRLVGGIRINNNSLKAAREKNDGIQYGFTRKFDASPSAIVQGIVDDIDPEDQQTQEMVDSISLKEQGQEQGQELVQQWVQQISDILNNDK